MAASLRGSRRLTRRNFLQGSAAAAAAAAVASPWRPEYSPAADRVLGANAKIVLGIIGCGTRGTQLSDNMPAGVEVAAVADCDLNKAGALVARHGAKWSIVQDYRRLMDRRDLDALIVCPTDPHHVQASILACQAGKDVYCEKPLSLTIAEGRALVRAARTYDRIVQTGTQQRTMEINRFACEFVRDGRLGRLRAVECVNFRSPEVAPSFPAEAVPEGLDWDLWLGPTPARPYSAKLHEEWWGRWRAYAGGMNTFLGAHAYDMVQYALGMDHTGPVEFWPVEEGPQARLRFRYANGVEVRLTFPDERPYRGPRNGAVFIGEDCKMEINRNKFVTNPPDFVLDAPDPEVAEKWEGPGWIAKGHVQNWLDCIRTRERPNADVEIGHRSATVCHLCNITRQLGRRLKWDPQREIFPEDAEANELLDRPRRKGWELPQIG